MIKKATVKMMEVYDNIAIPDEFTIVLKGSESDTGVEYTEVYYESEEDFNNDPIKYEDGVEARYEDGRGMIEIKDRGTRKEMLWKLLREILLQAKFYNTDSEISELVSSIKVERGDE